MEYRFQRMALSVGASGPTSRGGNKRALESVWQLGFGLCSARLQAGIWLNLKSRLEAGGTKNSVNQSYHTDPLAPEASGLKSPVLRAFMSGLKARPTTRERARAVLAARREIGRGIEE
jgi:hypothetical protein